MYFAKYSTQNTEAVCRLNLNNMSEYTEQEASMTAKIVNSQNLEQQREIQGQDKLKELFANSPTWDKNSGTP